MKNETAIHIRASAPDTDGHEPPDEVHLVFVEKTDTEINEVGYMFDSPEHLAEVIETLIAYRKYVWENAEPIDPEAAI